MGLLAALKSTLLSELCTNDLQLDFLLDGKPISHFLYRIIKRAVVRLLSSVFHFRAESIRLRHLFGSYFLSDPSCSCCEVF